MKDGWVEVSKHRDEAEVKAWDALSRYKFQMFGYWAAIWVHLNRIMGEAGLACENPWRELVKVARKNQRSWKRDPDSSCNDYEEGPVLKFPECETDGHYLCAGCIHNKHRAVEP